MKTILILSDTHMPKRAVEFPSRLQTELENGIDLIIHVGDIETNEIYNELKKYGPVKAVYGNVDEDLLQQILPLKIVLEIDGIRVGVTHGHGKKKTTEQRALNLFADEELDVLIYGHSHIPIYKEVGKTTIFNPGSATDKRRQKQYSFGKMIIQDGDFKLEHVYYRDKQ